MIINRTHRILIVVAVLAGVHVLWGCNEPADSSDTSLDVAAALSTDTSGYARADRPRAFVFPEDHGPHPEYRTEWWYYTGNLVDEAGRRFGYQFTIFRTSLRPPDESVVGDGSWATDQLFMAHFAVSDVQRDVIVAEERFSRRSAGLAGARAHPYQVWLEDWSVSALDSSFNHQQILASADDLSLELQLEASKPIVLHGAGGWDRKGPNPGDASYYYTVTRWSTTGTISVGGSRFNVTGTSWLDREWSTSVLGEDIRGWDWFALQLDDGRDIMYYQLRDEEGEPTDYSGGVLIDEEGARRPFTHEESTLEARDEWESPLGGTYPSGWRLRAPHLDIDLIIEPVMEHQELDFAVRYWEGAVDVAGMVEGTDVQGVGYVELTGYAEAARSRLSRH